MHHPTQELKLQSHNLECNTLTNQAIHSHRMCILLLYDQRVSSYGHPVFFLYHFCFLIQFWCVIPSVLPKCDFKQILTAIFSLANNHTQLPLLIDSYIISMSVVASIQCTAGQGVSYLFFCFFFCNFLLLFLCFFFFFLPVLLSIIIFFFSSSRNVILLSVQFKHNFHVLRQIFHIPQLLFRSCQSSAPASWFG